MSEDLTALYDRIADRFGDLLDRCPPDRWTSPSPCPGWTARDVAAHVVRNHRRALAGLDRSTITAPTAGEDIDRAWRDATDRVRAALRDPVRAATPMGAEFGPVTFAGFIRRMACADTLIHTWDFARATGQDEALDANGVETATTILIPEDRDIRMVGAFGDQCPRPPAPARRPGC
jgi:uncharacterized protein (TIGR03083 family)